MVAVDFGAELAEDSLASYLGPLRNGLVHCIVHRLDSTATSVRSLTAII